MLRLYLADKPISLHQAIREGNYAAVEQALQKWGPKTINKKDKDGFTALHVAAQSGRSDITKLLLEKGADLHAVDETGQSPLHIASIYGSLEVVQVFVREGADVLHTDKEGRKASNVICAGVPDKRRRHAICGLLSLAELREVQGSQSEVVEGHVSVESMLDRRLKLCDYIPESGGSEGPSTSSPSEASRSGAPSTFGSAPRTPSVDGSNMPEDSMVDIYNGAMFLNDDVRQSASHLRLREPLPGRHNFDIPYVKLWGD